MRVVADTDRCVGAGQCARTQPVLFDQDDADGTVVVLVDRVEDDLVTAARVAVSLCPVGAVAVVDEPDPRPANRPDRR